METLWFMIVAVMLTAYVILDGFDLGAGAIYLFAARTHDERQMILRAIGPVWDGNEVWLLAAGGTLYFAFPQLYASSFSGFYLPLMMVLWLLMLRAIGIEFRIHIDNPVWRGLFDVLFSAASILLAIFYGAALGNVIRGVPLSQEGYFFEALWTNFRVGPNPGILDWYTVLAGVVALVTLTVHGALYVALKTEGELETAVTKDGDGPVATAGHSDCRQPGGNGLCFTARVR
jgi:cytochrome bd ubiquinol oxidase subunit II